MYEKRIVYTQDGEIVRSSTLQFAGRFHDDKGYGLYSYGNMTSSRTDFKLHPSLTDAELGKLLRLSRRLQLETNALMYEASKGVRPMTHKQVSECLGVKEVHGYRFTKRMKDLGVIREVDALVMGGTERRLIMNPLYFMAGKYVSDDLYWMFNDELDEVFSEWIRKQYKQRRGVDEPSI